MRKRAIWSSRSARLANDNADQTFPNQGPWRLWAFVNIAPRSAHDKGAVSTSTGSRGKRRPGTRPSRTRSCRQVAQLCSPRADPLKACGEPMRDGSCSIRPTENSTASFDRLSTYVGATHDSSVEGYACTSWPEAGSFARVLMTSCLNVSSPSAGSATIFTMSVLT